MPQSALFPVLEEVADRLAQTLVGLQLLFLQLGLQPSEQPVHHRAALSLVEAETLLRREALRLGHGAVSLDLAQAFQHQPAGLGKVRGHLHKAAPIGEVNSSLHWPS